MATTRNNLLGELEERLGDTSNAVWTDAELEGLLDMSIRSLYPTYFKKYVDTTTAGTGPIQTAPSGAVNIFFIQVRREESARFRRLRRWFEGQGEAHVPNMNIDGFELAWGWTTGWDAPANGTDSIDIPNEAQEWVILRAQIGALESLLSSRVKLEKYHALHVRQGVTEDDIAVTLDALHVSLRENAERARPLPEIQD